MMEEKSLLKRIREKELEVSVRIDDVRVEADRMIERARRESAAALASSEEEGKKEAGEFLRRETTRLQAEADAIRVHAREQVRAVREKGEKKIPEAVGEILAIVLSG